MRLDRREQIIGAAVMQEEHALSDPPQRRGAELVRAGRTLTDAVGQPRAHVVDEQVGEQVHGPVL